MMRSMDNNWTENCCDGGMGSHLKSLLGSCGGGQELCHMIHDWADDMMVTENESGFKIALAIPGIRAISDITLTLRDLGQAHYLDLQWHRDYASNVSSEHVRWIGKAWGKCYKRIPLPEMCDVNNISASYDEGQLNIFVGKKTSGHGAVDHGKSIKIRSVRN